MNIQYALSALLAALILLVSNAQANLGDTGLQSENRYGRAFYTAKTPSGIMRSYRTLDGKYLVQQMFTTEDVVEMVCYIKIVNDSYAPLPFSSSEIDGLRIANISRETTFPEACLPLASQAANEKVWKSDDGKFYIDIGTLSAKDCPFGVTLDCVVFSTGPGYDNLQRLINTTKTTDHLQS